MRTTHGAILSGMGPDQFMHWRRHMGALRGYDKPLSERETAKLLGASRVGVIRWSTRGEVPRYVALACSAIAFGLPEWPGERIGGDDAND